MNGDGIAGKSIYCEQVELEAVHALHGEARVAHQNLFIGLRMRIEGKFGLRNLFYQRIDFEDAVEITRAAVVRENACAESDDADSDGSSFLKVSNRAADTGVFAIIGSGFVA